MATTTGSTVSSTIPNTVNVDLSRERNNATVDILELTHMLDGGKEATDRRRSILNIVFNDPVFSVNDKYFEDQSRRYERAVQRSFRVAELAVQHAWDQPDLAVIGRSLHYDFALTLHQAMFIPALERLCNDAQREKWLPLAYTMNIIGTYAQTEMGHGTNLRALETTATFDVKSQEFVINTPLPSGMKWWPGALGKSVNHAIVLATLFVRGENLGMQAFVVPLRDIETHQPLPGIELGSIGPKIGLQGGDNGYLILHDVRVPRDNMLSKYVKVDSNGQVHKSKSAGSEKVNYGTMVLVRANLVAWAYESTSQAVTIATRYSLVRHQSELNPSEGEPQVIEYKAQQQKLFTGLASAYAFHFAKTYIMNEYTRIYEDELSVGNFKHMPQLHIQCSGLKAYCGDLTMEIIEICRRACGGHGYLMASGLCDLYGDSLAMVTVEGENTVLYLQVARYLMKQYTAANNGTKLFGFVDYLNTASSIASNIQNSADCENLTLMRAIFQKRAFLLVEKASKGLQRSAEKGASQHVAVNNLSLELIRAAKAHIENVLCSTFIDGISQSNLSPKSNEMMRILCSLFCVHRILCNTGDFVETSVLSGAQIDMLREHQLTLLAKIRPEAIALVDAFDWHDVTLNSCLGAYDGNVYHRLFDWAKRTPLNKTQVHDAFHKYAKPFREFLAKL